MSDTIEQALIDNLDPEDKEFLIKLDGMIESTEEFIKDDGLMTDESRIHDLSALLHVREVFLSTFTMQT